MQVSSHFESLPHQGPTVTDATAPENDPAEDAGQIHDEIRRNLFSALTNLALALHQQKSYQRAEALATQFSSHADAFHLGTPGRAM